MTFVCEVLWELLTHEVPYRGIEGFQVAWLVVEKGEVSHDYCSERKGRVIWCKDSIHFSFKMENNYIKIPVQMRSNLMRSFEENNHDFKKNWNLKKLNNQNSSIIEINFYTHENTCNYIPMYIHSFFCHQILLDKNFTCTHTYIFQKI